jgi:VWFA-related protein
VDVLQDFTADRDRLLSILQTLVVGEGQNDNGPNSGDDSASDTGAAFGQDDGEFNIFTTDRQLAALQTAAELLGHLNEKKSLIYFASGLNLNGLDNQAQLHATVDAAVRAGVSFWPIDARGLVAQGPLGDATKGSQGNQAMYTGAAALAVTSSFQKSQDTLFALAGDTGGKALLDNNDLGRGIVQAQHAISDYYILGYYTTNTELNGKFRKIKITVGEQLAASLDYRQGYFAGKTFGKFTTADKERQLEDALMLGDPITELTIATEINYFQLNRAEYFVPVMIKIPGRELALAKKRGAEQTVIDFIGEIKDVYGGTTVTNIRDHVTATLANDTAEQLARRPIEYSSGYTLLPGKYTIKVLARDDVTGRMGTFQTAFTIPNLNKETKQVPISSVVLSSERFTAKQAIYNVTKEKDQAKQEAANPLVQNGQQLIPSVTRVFSRSRTLFVYLQGYVPSQTSAQMVPTVSGSKAANAPVAAAGAGPSTEPLIAYLALYHDQSKVFESEPLESTPSATSRVGVTPINFAIDLSKLQPGMYRCQVTVLDPAGGKETFWQAPIQVVP